MSFLSVHHQVDERPYGGITSIQAHTFISVTFSVGKTTEDIFIHLVVCLT